jgi:hypothetical protein
VFGGKGAGKDILSYNGQGKWSWRRLHNEKVHDVQFSPDIRMIYSGRLRWVGHVARMGGRRGVLKDFVERSEKKRSLRRANHILADNTKMKH